MKKKYIYIVESCVNYEGSVIIGAFDNLKDAKIVGNTKCNSGDYIQITRIILNQKLGDLNCVYWKRTCSTNWERTIG